MSQARNFGQSGFDPEMQEQAVHVHDHDHHKEEEEDKDNNKMNTLSNSSQTFAPPRNSSNFVGRRARGSLNTWRASLSKDPGWDRKTSNIMGASKGSLAGGSEGLGDGDGNNGAEEIDYNTLSWWQAGFIMIAETVSLGILALPSVLATVGLVPGIILIAVLGVMATYSGYVIGQFRLRYPWVHSFGDAGEILGEPIGAAVFFKELFGWAQAVFQIFTMASHILTWTICFNTLTDSAACTVVWSVIGLVVFWILDSPRTLNKVSYMSIVSFISIFSAVFITMVDVGIEKPIADKSLLVIPGSLPFTTAFLSVSNISFAFAGHACFFGFIAEFRDPTEWPKALMMLQITDTTLYLVAAIVIYVFAGPDVDSPALGSAGPIVKKVAWGVALPTIVIAGVIYGHIAAKYIFVRMFRGTKHINTRTKFSTVCWLGLTGVLWTISWIIAESIPNFNSLLALISALFVSWFSFGLPGIFWLFMNWGSGNDAALTEKSGVVSMVRPAQNKWSGATGLFKTWRKTCLTIANVTLLVVAVLICVLGLWSSGVAIHNESGGASWTCASNAQ